MDDQKRATLQTSRKGVGRQKETIPERGQTERLVEKSLSWCRQNSKMILFQQGRTLPLFSSERRSPKSEPD